MLQGLLKAIVVLQPIRSIKVTMDVNALHGLGFALVIGGIMIMAIAFLFIIASSWKRKGEARGGGVIIIGPVPIIFGTDKQSIKIVSVLSIVLTILTLSHTS